MEIWDENLDAPAPTTFESMAVQKKNVHTRATEGITLDVLEAETHNQRE